MKDSASIGPSNPSPGFISKKLEITYSQRYRHPRVHCSMIHGGEDAETTNVSRDGGRQREDAVHVRSGTALSCEEGWNSAIGSHVDGPCEHDAE